MAKKLIFELQSRPSPLRWTRPAWRWAPPARLRPFRPSPALFSKANLGSAQTYYRPSLKLSTNPSARLSAAATASGRLPTRAEDEAEREWREASENRTRPTAPGGRVEGATRHAGRLENAPNRESPAAV